MNHPVHPYCYPPTKPKKEIPATREYPASRENIKPKNTQTNQSVSRPREDCLHGGLNVQIHAGGHLDEEVELLDECLLILGCRVCGSKLKVNP